MLVPAQERSLQVHDSPRHPVAELVHHQDQIFSTGGLALMDSNLSYSIINLSVFSSPKSYLIIIH